MLIQVEDCKLRTEATILTTEANGVSAFVKFVHLENIFFPLRDIV